MGNLVLGKMLFKLLAGVAKATPKVVRAAMAVSSAVSEHIEKLQPKISEAMARPVKRQELKKSTRSRGRKSPNTRKSRPTRLTWSARLPCWAIISMKKTGGKWRPISSAKRSCWSVSRPHMITSCTTGWAGRQFAPASSISASR